MNKISKDKIIKTLTKIYFDWVEHEVKVTKIGSGWNVRVYTNGEVSQEVRVFDRSRIGIAAREMLRWEDKCGNLSKFASNARNRTGRKAIPG